MPAWIDGHAAVVFSGAACYLGTCAAVLQKGWVRRYEKWDGEGGEAADLKGLYQLSEFGLAQAILDCWGSRDSLTGCRFEMDTMCRNMNPYSSAHH